MSLFEWRDRRPAQMTDAWYAENRDDSAPVGTARNGWKKANPIAATPCTHVCSNSKRIKAEIMCDNMEFIKGRDYSGLIKHRPARDTAGRRTRHG